MPAHGEVFTAAAVQATPVYLSKRDTTEKVCSLVLEAASQGARLVVFPELFISMYPNWVPDVFNPNPQEASRYIGRNWHEYWSDFIDEAVEVPGPETRRIGQAAEEAGAWVVIGVNERDPVHGRNGKLYNTAVTFSPDGQIAGRRRKLTPVVHELLYHARGGADDVTVVPTDLGVIGVAQCFEHLSPLYRHALGVLGEEVHCALWYAVGGISHLVDASARQHAMEMGVWVVVSVHYDPPDPVPGPHGDLPGWRSAGGSGIMSPWGQYIAGPVYGEETIVYGEIDPAQIRSFRAAWDSMGKDGRPDVFRFSTADATPARRSMVGEDEREVTADLVAPSTLDDRPQ